MKRNSPSSSIRPVMLPVILMWSVATGLAVSPQADAQAPQAVGLPAQKNTVQLVIDYGDGVEKHFSRLPWRNKMTVQDVTLAGSKHPRGIRIKQTGKKATAFLTQIDDLANQRNGRNWVYRVNGKVADRSFGIFPVQAGDVVTWTYQEYP